MSLAGAEHATVPGGAHLSAAFAPVAALPTTLMGREEVVGTAGDVWALTCNAPAPDGPNQRLSVDQASPASAAAGTVLVYLYLLSDITSKW